MDTKQLEYLVALVEEGSVRAAAARSQISQPGLSTSIKRLEAELGTALFERVGRRIQPTTGGLEFFEHAKLALAQLRLGSADLGDGKNITLRFGIGESRRDDFLGRFASAMVSLYPGAAIEFVEENYERLIPKVVSGEIDAAFLGVPRGSVPRSLERVSLIDTPMGVYCRPTHPLAVRGTLLTDEELADAAWIQSRSAPGRPTENARPDNASLIVDSTYLLRQVLQHADYLAVLPELVIERELATARLVRLETQRFNFNVSVVAIRRRDLNSKALDAALDIARECFEVPSGADIQPG